MIGRIVAKILHNKSNDARKDNFFIVPNYSVNPETFWSDLVYHGYYPFEENNQLVSEKGSSSRGVPIPVNAQPFGNIASNSGEIPTVRCTEWLKKRITLP